MYCNIQHSPGMHYGSVCVSFNSSERCKSLSFMQFSGIDADVVSVSNSGPLCTDC